MIFHHATAHTFVPDQVPLEQAMARITHLGIGAHQDDLEFMAFQGILACHEHEEQWFGGVTCTNGGGSSRSGRYASMSDEQMILIRRREQNDAAVCGNYGVMVQLDYTSREIQGPNSADLSDDLAKILRAAQPEIVYTHNPADKHPSHLAVTLAALRALRSLPPSQRPRQVIGCEVWRDLDWLPDRVKVRMNVSGGDALAVKLHRIFDSQIAGGKRYDLAVLGRRAANATFLDSHATDATTQMIFGMDLTPLVADESLDLVDYVTDLIDQFRIEVRQDLGGMAARLA